MTPKQILLAEDDANFGLMLKIFLEMNGYAIELCENGEIAIGALAQKTYDLCILDVMMPKVNGFTVAQHLQEFFPQTPFVFLTAKSLKEDQIQGYKSGAVDYLIKPFDPEILLLKVKAILEIHKNNTETSKQTFEIGNFTFDYTKRLLIVDTKQQKLSPKEAELLKMLCEKNGEVLTHEEALVKIWKNDDYFTRQSMNVFITKLRKYLSLDTQNKIEIENIHSKGFLLKY